MKLRVAGYASCGYFKTAAKALQGLSAIFPDRLAVQVDTHETRDEYKAWLPSMNGSLGAPGHTSSPIVWMEGDTNSYIGGCDDTLVWCKSFVNVGEAPLPTVVPNIDEFNPNHGFDYDLMVIGGGSGGLACSKVAAKLLGSKVEGGARVACLDYVKPSPKGTTWGLGGTCVNVGCIPKKLMHTAAILHEMAHDAKSYGWEGGDGASHNWNTLKENVQDHIKGINFGYRVQLREKGVEYLNKLGKFVGPNTVELTDKKGNVTTKTAARFVIAVGGRPTPLDCPGAEHAITSDDLFKLEKSPGKTCVVGAGYVALECAGFISGLKQGDVTVLVRSMPLRGFDREIVDKVQGYMEHAGLKMVIGALPKSIEKLDNGQLEVTYTTGEKDTFDTVMAAIGRYADVDKLNLESLGIQLNPKNKKIICNNEQSSVPHIYAIGDVVDDAPELTPVAIQAGTLLAKRLFGGSKELMVYKDIATAIFTPLEIGTVGLSEEEAIAKYGQDKIDCFASAFQPLEWSVCHKDTPCFAKILVVGKEQKVVGLHICAPNAGEIIQGYAVAFRKGMYYEDLMKTVGIHPTTAEEFTTMEISKYNLKEGESIEKSGC